MDEIDLTTIPDEFKELLRTKLKKQDDATYNEALSLYGRNLLGFYRVMRAAPGSIDLDEIKEAQRKAERDEAERRAKYEKEREYDAGLTWLYETDNFQFTGGYYAGIDDAGVIRHICYESGDHRSGGPVYSNTPFGQFGDFNTQMGRVKAYAPALYAKIKDYRQQ
jgi:hypothetical protein|nr:MAG TPA: hypothetical protein [Caudoviricetes sp.]